MSDQFIGQTLAEKYQIDSVIRDGDSNHVYRATHLLMDKPVTVKILAPQMANDDERVANFSAEAKKVSHLAHPNILNAIDFGKDKDGAVFIVFDGADGEILAETLRRVGKLPVERAVKISGQIAAALSAAHAYGIVHGQLNADNVMLIKNPNGSESVKLLDFGAGESSLQKVSLKNMQYLSPEQNSLGATPDARSDIYALGVIFYEMLANEVPFVAGTPTELLIKQSSNPPAPLSAFRKDIVPDIEPIVLKALARNPEMRYQTAHEFVGDLNGATDTKINTDAVVLPPLEEKNESAANNLWKTAFVVLAGISLLAVGLIYMTSSKQTNPATSPLSADANGQPVQPLNPATGMNEQGTAGMINPYNPGQMMPGANSNSMMPMVVPPTLQNGGDGYGDGKNYWGGSGPPPGAPIYVPQGGQMIDPNNPNSIFMQDGTVLVPVPVNGNVSVNTKPSPTPAGKPTPNTANANVAQPSGTPAANPSPTPPKPTATPAVKPTTPKTNPLPAAPPKQPSATQKETTQSGKEQDT